jgi:hypothetical protein
MLMIAGSQHHESPFDSIRQVDGRGNEFWWARELMPMMRYKSWQKFDGVISIAKENLETVTDSVIDHINPTDKVVKRPQGGGSTQSDYKLSRLACYHIALCCDSRGNDAVKMAKHYFAVKTREAETVIPAQNDRIRELELRLKIAELEKATSDNNTWLMARSEFIVQAHGPQMLALIQGRPDAVVEKIEKVTETVICQGDRKVSFTGKSTAELGRELGFKTGKEFERWLTKHGYQDKICEGLRAIQAPYIPVEYIADIKRLWSQTRKTNGTQLMLGE